jgi:hypothetical protein
MPVFEIMGRIASIRSRFGSLGTPADFMFPASPPLTTAPAAALTSRHLYFEIRRDVDSVDSAPLFEDDAQWSAKP